MNFLSIKKWSIIILLVANAIVLNCTTADTALSPTSNEADETKNIEPVVVEKEKRILQATMSKLTVSHKSVFELNMISIQS